MKNKNAIRNMVFVSLGAVLLTIGGWITVPFAIPFTMQTFVLFLILDLFGGKIGFFSVVTYLGIGLIGIPVFSGFNSGISAFLGPTGGFILGFLISGAVYLALNSILINISWSRWVIPFFSLGLCYGCGTLWYMQFVNVEMGFAVALSICVFPYIIPDCIKIFMALIFSKRLKRFILP